LSARFSATSVASMIASLRLSRRSPSPFGLRRIRYHGIDY
jgi:hypothetical protein